MSSEERKATDILLSIEKDVKELLAYQKNNDLTNRLILERLRIFSENPRSNLPNNASPSPPKMEAIEQPVKNSPFTQPSNIKDKIRQAMADASSKEEELSDIKFSDQLEVENVQSGKRRGTRIQTAAEKQVAVQQKIIGPDDKNLFMAKVEIFDENGNLSKSTKTNQTGKWLAQLLPGKYSVLISKAGSANKPAIEVTYDIDIPENNSNFELNPKKV